MPRVLCVLLLVCSVCCTMLPSEDGNETYQLEPISFCDDIINLDEDRSLYSPNVVTPVASISFVPEQDAILIASYPDNERVLHDARLTYQLFDLRTGNIVAVNYPDADVVTHELTDRLGITDQVFGRNSTQLSLFVSPNRDRILYFTISPSPALGESGQESLVDFYTLWTANIDGTEAVELGFFQYPSLPMLWGDEYVYLPILPGYGDGRDLYQACLDGTCKNYIDLSNAELPEAESYFFDKISARQDGSMLAITHKYLPLLIIYDVNADTSWCLPSSDINSGFPPAWSSDGQAIYYLNSEGQVIRHFLGPLPGEDATEVITTGSPTPGDEWLLLPDYRMTVFNNGSEGILINCYDSLDMSVSAQQ